jgi:glycosyltransferase involved in cell wall biosynthesis
MNFPPGTGYAWATIERVMRGVADRLTARGDVVFVGYPGLGASVPPAWEGSTVKLLDLDYQAMVATRSGIQRLVAMLRDHRVDALYLTDQPTWAFRYFLLRLAGIRLLIVHDRTSGERSSSGRLAAVGKQVLHRLPGLGVSAAIAVSKFVADRLVRINGVPAHRCFVVYNGIPLEKFDAPAPGGLARLIGVPDHVPIVFLSGRAQPYKGIETAIQAAALLEQSGEPEAHFVYCGDGSGLPRLRSHAEERGVRRFHFLGRRDDIPSLLGSATLAIVPSHWGEAFGLTVVEAMAAGVPVIATRVGGIPELISHQRTGVLIPPRNAEALAEAIRELLHDPEKRVQLSVAGREDARSRFGVERVVEDLDHILEKVRPR